MSDAVAVKPSDLMVPNDAGEVTLINPSSGEQVVLSDASDDQLGAFIDAISEWTSRASEAKALASAEMTRRMDRSATWTIHTQRWTFKGRSPAPATVYTDAEKLSAGLHRLADAGEITHEAAAAAVEVETKTTYSPKHGKLVAVSKASAKAARLVKRHTQKVTPASRSVSLSRR